MTKPSRPQTKTAARQPAPTGARKPEAIPPTAATSSESGRSASRRRRRRHRTPPKPSSRPTRVIAVANQKGGVGKSTTAVSLGAALAEIGYRVLVVDLDPQGNASTGLGIRHEHRDVTVYEVLAAEAPIAGAIVQTPVANLWAIPSTIDLAGAEIELVSQFSRELRLRKALEPLREDSFDFVFLDCPPSLGLLTVNALAAAEELLVPIQCEYYALEGLGQLLRNVRLVQQNVNPTLHLAGIVMTMFDPRTKLSEQVVQEVRRFFGDQVYETIIPRTVRLSEAPGFGQPITVYDSRSRGAECYRELAREVASREPLDEPLPEELPQVAVQPPERHVVSAPRPLTPSHEDEAEEGLLETLRTGSLQVEPDSDEGVKAEANVEPSAESEVEDRAAGHDAQGVEIASGGHREDDDAEFVPVGAQGGDEEEASAAAEGSKGPAAAGPSAGAEGDVGVQRSPEAESDHPGLDQAAAGVSSAPPEPAREGEAHRRRWSLFRRGGSS